MAGFLRWPERSSVRVVLMRILEAITCRRLVQDIIDAASLSAVLPASTTNYLLITCPLTAPCTVVTLSKPGVQFFNWCHASAHHERSDLSREICRVNRGYHRVRLVGLSPLR